MNIIPDSDIILLKCPLELDNKNQITFSTAEAQFNYFNSLPKIVLDNASYVRKDESIRVPELLEDILQYNYLMYRNHNYSDKWIYAFITDSEYLNDNCTRIDFETDVFQTWQFDLEYKPSFVIREHVNDDTIGKHTLPENLDIGEPIAISETNYTDFNSNYYVGVLTDWIPTNGGIGTGDQYDGITIFNKGVFGHQCIVFKLQKNPSGTTTPDVEDIRKYLLITNGDGHIGDVKDMFIIPGGLIDENASTGNVTLTPVDRTIIGTTHITFSFWKMKESFTPKSVEYKFLKPTTSATFPNLTIRNNKCYCYPYNYLQIRNNNGNHNNYRYENFSDSTYATFNIDLALSIGISGQCVPTGYLGVANNYAEGIPLGKYPTCNWSADSFTNWLTQQAVNIPTRLISGGLINTGRAVEGMRNASAKDFAGAIGSEAGEIAGLIGEFYSASLSPNIEGGGNVGDVLFSDGGNTFTFKAMRPKDEYIQQIDDYFTMFGYKVNELKIPNITGRSNWNYVETQNINILADIPQNDLNLIKEMFNNGITLWHTTNYFLDYSRTNSIV